MGRSRIGGALTVVLVLAVAACAWLAFAPARLGGRVTFAVVRGSSMSPEFRAGDLVLLKPAASYQVGEVVGYQNRELDTLVLHRIVAIHGSSYVFKGDNNGFLDPFHPTGAELVGTVWLRVPVVGAGLTWLRTPLHAALLVALALVAVAAGASRRPRARAPAAAEHAGILAACGLVALAVSLCLGVLAYSRAATASRSLPQGYQLETTFSYRGAATGSVYAGGAVRAGEPVFTRLVHQLALGVRSRLSSTLPHEVGGTLTVAASLTSGLGWRHELARARAPLHDGAATARLTLDLARVEAATAGYLSQTHEPSDTFQLVIAPRVGLRGVVDGEPVAQSETPAPLVFDVDPYTLRLATPAPALEPGQPQPDPLQSTSAGPLTEPAASTLDLAGLRLSVERARHFSLDAALVGALLLVVSFAGFGWTRARERHDERARIRRRYGRLILAAMPGAASAPAPIGLRSFEELARVAVSCGSPILDDGRCFVVRGGTTAYEYRPGAAANGFAAAARIDLPDPSTS